MPRIAGRTDSCRLPAPSHSQRRSLLRLRRRLKTPLVVAWLGEVRLCLVERLLRLVLDSETLECSKEAGEIMLVPATGPVGFPLRPAEEIALLLDGLLAAAHVSLVVPCRLHNVANSDPGPRPSPFMGEHLEQVHQLPVSEVEIRLVADQEHRHCDNAGLGDKRRESLGEAVLALGLRWCFRPGTHQNRPGGWNSVRRGVWSPDPVSGMLATGNSSRPSRLGWQPPTWAASGIWLTPDYVAQPCWRRALAGVPAETCRARRRVAHEPSAMCARNDKRGSGRQSTSGSSREPV